MSWFREKQQKSWIHQFCTRVLKAGPMPRHVAIIMDGNRRFAVKNSIDRAEGHLKGFDKLSETLEWCLDLGILEVTVYAFSIENFKRSKEEVDCLMELARQKFARLMQEKELIQKHEVCVRVLGNLELLPLDIQEIIAECVDFSKNNSRATLNVCFAYTSRDEICMAMREIADGVSRNLIRESDISEDLIEKCLYTARSAHPDLLIRTSGEVRLSDFLLWQSSYSCLSFVKVLWPEFSIWHLYAAVLEYQRNYPAIQDAIQQNKAERERLQRESDQRCIMENISAKSDFESGKCNLRSEVTSYRIQRQARIDGFLKNLYEKRDRYFLNLAAKRSRTANIQ